MLITESWYSTQGKLRENSGKTQGIFFRKVCRDPVVFLVLKPSKCHFMILGIKNISLDFIHHDTIIKHNTSQNLLGAVIDENFDFFSEVCKKG